MLRLFFPTRSVAHFNVLTSPKLNYAFQFDWMYFVACGVITIELVIYLG